MIGGIISCNKADNINLDKTDSTQITDTDQNAYSEKETSKKQVFLNYNDILDRYRALLNNSNTQNSKLYLDENDYRIETALQ